MITKPNHKVDLTKDVVGLMNIETAEQMNLDQCSRCGSKEIIAIIEIPAKMEEIPVKKMYATCKKCCDETGIKIPSVDEVQQ